MERESEYLLHLLGAYLRKEEPEIWQDVDWYQMLRLSGIHNLSGILGYMTMNDPVCPEEQLCSVLRKRCLGTMMDYANRGALAEEFLEVLTDRGIDHILIKGFILRDYYPMPELRTYGDIDLIIREKDREKCHGLMQELGFAVKTDWEPVYSYTREQEYYEIHTQLLETDIPGKDACRAYFGTPWEHAQPVDTHRFELKPEYHFLYLMTHLAKHVAGSGAGIRMYLDIAVLIQQCRNSLNWAEIEAELKALELDSFANVVFNMVETCFGIPKPITGTPVPREVLNSFLDFTVSGGIFGRVGKESGVISLKETSREDEDISRSGTIVKRLFPTAKNIENRYTYLKKAPWLLPAAWVHRLVKTGGRLREHAKEARSILSADKEAARELNQLYREIGL